MGSASPLSLLGPGAFCRTSSAAAAAPSPNSRPVDQALLAARSPHQPKCHFSLCQNRVIAVIACKNGALNHPLSPAPGAGCSEVARHSLWDSFYTAAQVSDPAACPLGVFIACRGDFSLCQILVTCGYQAPRSALVILFNRTLPGKHIS